MMESRSLWYSEGGQLNRGEKEEDREWRRGEREGGGEKGGKEGGKGGGKGEGREGGREGGGDAALTYKFASLHPTALYCYSESHGSGTQQLQVTCGEELGIFCLQGYCLGGMKGKEEQKEEKKG